jgi:hypothetical protein
MTLQFRVSGFTVSGFEVLFRVARLPRLLRLARLARLLRLARLTRLARLRGGALETVNRVTVYPRTAKQNPKPSNPTLETSKPFNNWKLPAGMTAS